MRDNNDYCVRPGLPRYLSSGTQGFDALCVLLSIDSTQRKQGISKAPSVKAQLKAKGYVPPRNAKTAERLRHRLTFLYSDPDARRMMWRHKLALDPDDLDSAHRLIPSFEHAALERYDREHLTADPDPDGLAECAAFYSPEATGEDWHVPALAALAAVHRDFAEWDSLSAERQADILAAAVAVATILDDVRLLRWAADQSTDIANEFAFARNNLKASELVTASDPASDPADPTTPDVLSDLRNTAQALIAATNNLLDGPLSATGFDAIDQLADRIQALRQPALSFSSEQTRERLLGALASFLRRYSGTAPWLASQANDIVAEWGDAYATNAHTTTEKLQADLERAQREVASHLEQFADLDRRAIEAEANLREHQASMAASANPGMAELELEAKYAGEAYSSKNALLDARRRIQAASRPIPSRSISSPTHTADREQDTPPSQETRDPSESQTTNQKEDAPATEEPPPVREPLAVSKTSAAPTNDESTRLPSPFQPHQVDEPTNEKRDTPFDKAEAATWTAIREGRPGLAYQIARFRLTVGGEVSQPTDTLLATLALGSSLYGPDEGLAHELGHRSGVVLSNLPFGEPDDQKNTALNLLLFSAALRPALFAPQQTDAIPMLRRVDLAGDLTPVYSLGDAIAGHAEVLKGVRLDVATLSAVLDEGVWRDQLDNHLAQLQQWQSSAEAANFKYGGASLVWKNWLTPAGIVGELTALVSGTDAKSAPRVREIVDQLSDRKSVDELVQATFRAERASERGKIVGPALAQIVRRLDGLTGLACKWLAIVEAIPTIDGFVGKATRRLRRDIQGRGANARKSIVQAQQSNPALPLAAALQCALNAIDSLDRMFRPGNDGEILPSDGTAQALTDDLLYVPGVSVDDGEAIHEQPSPDRSLALLIDADSHATTLSVAFEMRLQQGDIYGAHAVCEKMTRIGDPAEDVCRDRLSSQRRMLRRRLYDLSEKLEQSFIIGQVSEDNRDDLNRKIVATQEQLRHEDQAAAAVKTAAMVETRVEQHFRNGIRDIKDRLQTQFPDQDPRESALIQDALDAEDLITLNEQLDCLKAGQPLLTTDTSERSPLADFLTAIEKISESMESDSAPSPINVVNAVSRRQDILGLAFASLSATQAERSFELLNLWYLMAHQRSASPTQVAGFLAFLGFRIGGQAAVARGKTAISIKTEPLRNRALCPDHSFGSSADGRYDIILNWTTPAPDQIIQAIRPNASSTTIVFHFGRLPMTDRESLRSWSLRESNQFLTVDETLVLYLASLPTDTLRSFFDCTLPFTSTEPFFTAAGLIPPESFYGRENERRKVMDRFDSCFVYGGRQLGKTALLRSAEAMFHDPDSRHLAHCIDLKMHDIGIAHGPDHVWQVLWDAFSKLGVIAADQRKPRGRDGLVKTLMHAISEWLSQDEDSRILLLLDEADAFLKADLERDFPESTRLKGLMDETQRKFKVVLCGLHNVLRNTERANHPLAHFGEPICVGPLLNNGDQEQARALIREPLATAGYSFVKPNLMNHILVWTNYYPSLIQLYGEALLRHLRESANRQFPYAVTFDDIQAVLSKDGFRDYIRQRFSLTLALDQRYEVVVYAMAFDLLGNPEGFSTGLPAIEILHLAKDAWPEGFDTPEAEFDTLLHEMCGLGVLRRRSGAGGRAFYVFRNPNVFLLLGDSDTILHILVKDRSVPDVFEASAYHAQYPRENPQSHRRGPLTYADESVLQRGRRVAVLCGTPASSLNEVDDFLEQRLEDGRLRRLEPCIEDGRLRRQLGAFRSTQKHTFAFLVDQDDPWSLHWLETAASALETLSKGTSMRVVFRANPAQLWHFVSDLPDEYLDDGNDLFDWVRLQPWNEAFLRRWCTDQNLHEALAKLDELLDITGGWPLVLQHYAELGAMGWDAKKEQLEQYIDANRKVLLDALGLGSDRYRIPVVTLLDSDCRDARAVAIYSTRLADEGRAEFSALTLPRRLYWARCLGLVQDLGGSLSFNPLVERLLRDDRS